MQGLCILTSLMSLSLITTSYQRYETQAKGGRTRVWFKRDEDAVDSEEPTILLAAGATPAGDVLPVRRRWTKVSLLTSSSPSRRLKN
ncbi:unnamed protein product [Nesidiocoris tenuis]|uniref:Uncharacterized protein n=1 Tax=Nesidiocoris tenuis TaxID=355587 RepID=A0A6H5GYJ8_9HEMI|nr:unnamed protein product [Nesidiocoris tenuis]